jgi:hypothetical protein
VKTNIVALQLEHWIGQKMLQIMAPPRVEIVDAQNVVAPLKKPFAQMRAYETGPAGY